MLQTIVALFHSHAAAQAAADELIAQGYAQRNICVSEGTAGGAAIPCAADDPKTKGMRRFLTQRFAPYEDRHARSYHDALVRGECMLAVHASSDVQVDRATAILDKHNAIDMDCYAEQWAAGTWAAHEATQAGRQGQAAMSQQAAAGMAAGGRHETEAPPPSVLDDETYYRMHLRSYYADDARYGDYEQAYRYGSAMAADEMQPGRSWDEAEPSIRSGWESEHTGSAWDKMKAAIRHGWSRAATQRDMHG
jgi:hypothetical protein